MEKLSSIENNYLQNCGIYVFDSQDNSNLPFEYFNQNIIPLLTKQDIKSKFNQMSNLNLLMLNIMIHQFMIILFLKILIFQKTNKNVSKLLDNLKIVNLHMK